MNRIQQNVLANYAGRAWGFISMFLFVPIYLKFLGIEAYGLVGFYGTLMAVMIFADMGFTATLNREMARLSARKDSAKDMRDLLRTYEATYVCVSAMVATVIWLSSPLIAEHWLHSDVLPPSEIAAVIRLMGIAIALQLPAGLFVGGLMGLQQQVLVNSLQVAWGVLRGLGAVLILGLVSPTIFAFALWQMIANAIYVIFVRLSLWRALSASSDPTRPQFRWQIVRNTWRYAAGMTGMAIIYTLLTQVDMLAVSKMLSLDMLGYYSLAATLASITGMLAAPIATAVFPRLTKLSELGDHDSLVKLYHRTSELVAVATIPAGCTVALFSVELILVWTGLPEVAHRAGLAASLLVVGALMQSITVTPYYVALAHGDVRLNLRVGIASVALLIPLLLVLIPEYGILGAAASWLAMNICIMCPYMYFLHRRFLPGELRRWCFRSLARPLLFSLPVVLLGRWLLPHTDSRLLLFCLVGLTWSVAVAATAAVVPDIRHLVMKTLSRLTGVPNEAY